MACGVVGIHIPECVEEICDQCFVCCKSLLRVTFGESSSLKILDRDVFRGSGLGEIQFPQLEVS